MHGDDADKRETPYLRKMWASANPNPLKIFKKTCDKVIKAVRKLYHIRVLEKYERNSYECMLFYECFLFLYITILFSLIFEKCI